MVVISKLSPAVPDPNVADPLIASLLHPGVATTN